MYNQPTVISAPTHLQDMFVSLTPGKSARELYQEYGDDIAEWYEDNRLIYIDNYPFNINTDLLWRTDMFGPGDIPHSLKKMKVGSALAPITKPFNKETHILGHFVKPAEDAFAMQDLIRKVRKELQSIARELFPKYYVVEEARGFSIRLTCQAGEEIHFDSYDGMDDDNFRVRVFANLDCRPRIWATGGLLEDWLHTVDDDTFNRAKDHHPNKANEFFNNKIDWDKYGDLAYMMFAPMSVWLVSSQPVSHEITYGRRMASQTTVVKTESMLNPERAFHIEAEKLWDHERQRRLANR